jgi:hypothetical protein
VLKPTSKSHAEQRTVAFLDRVQALLEAQQQLFCETVARAMHVSKQDMRDFETTLQENKSDNKRYAQSL